MPMQRQVRLVVQCQLEWLNAFTSLLRNFSSVRAFFRCQRDHHRHLGFFQCPKGFSFHKRTFLKTITQEIRQRRFVFNHRSNKAHFCSHVENVAESSSAPLSCFFPIPQVILFADSMRSALFTIIPCAFVWGWCPPYDTTLTQSRQCRQ